VGIGTEENWTACWPAERAWHDYAVRSGAVRRAHRRRGQGFRSPASIIEKKDVKKMDVFIQYALVASQFAMDDANLTITPEIADEVGVFIASGIGGFSTIEREHVSLLNGGPRRISPFFIPASIINLAAGQVSIRFGARGPNLATCTACTASAHAVGEATKSSSAATRP
jgi:3-oxoacyl-[acyl-carrier-protein] synthase II